MVAASYTAVVEMKGTSPFVYVSESIIRVLGYAPEEILGLPSSITSRASQRSYYLRMRGLVSVENLVSYVVYSERQHKDGHWFTIQSLLSTASDFVVVVGSQASSRFDKNPSLWSVAQDVFRIDDSGLQLLGRNRTPERDQAIQSFMRTDLPDMSRPAFANEPRAIIVADRKSRRNIIKYATPPTLTVLGVRSGALHGFSLLSFVHPADRPHVKTVLTVIKERKTLTGVDFKFLSTPTFGAIDVQSVIMASTDDVVFVVRRCEPAMPINRIDRGLTPPTVSLFPTSEGTISISVETPSGDRFVVFPSFGQPIHRTPVMELLRSMSQMTVDDKNALARERVVRSKHFLDVIADETGDSSTRAQGMIVQRLKQPRSGPPVPHVPDVVSGPASLLRRSDTTMPQKHTLSYILN